MGLFKKKYSGKLKINNIEITNDGKSHSIEITNDGKVLIDGILKTHEIVDKLKNADDVKECNDGLFFDSLNITVEKLESLEDASVENLKIDGPINEKKDNTETFMYCREIDCSGDAVINGNVYMENADIGGDLTVNGILRSSYSSFRVNVSGDCKANGLDNIDLDVDGDVNIFTTKVSGAEFSVGGDLKIG